MTRQIPQVHKEAAGHVHDEMRETHLLLHCPVVPEDGTYWIGCVIGTAVATGSAACWGSV